MSISSLHLLLAGKHVEFSGALLVTSIRTTNVGYTKIAELALLVYKLFAEMVANKLIRDIGITGC